MSSTAPWLPASGSGPSTTAMFNGLKGIVFRASDGSVFVADNNNHRIRQILAGTVSTVAGTGAAGYVNGGLGTSVLNFPYGLALHSNDDDLYFSETGNNCIRKLTISTASVSDGAGTCTLSGFTDGAVSSSRFGSTGPLGIAS